MMNMISFSLKTTTTQQNNLELVKNLINKSVYINLQDNEGGTALINASYDGYIKIVKELIKAGANINLQDKYDNTALIFACYKGHIKIVKELIKADANINLQNIYGYSALINASCNGHIEIVKELIKADADIDNEFIKNIKKYDVDILKLLVNNNFNIALEYVKKFNKLKDLKYYIKLLIINYIDKFEFVYEKGLINIILNYCV